MRDPSRREFLESICAGAAAGVLAGGSAVAHAYPANDTIHVGVIGCGGRARGALMPKTMALPGVKIIALCDVYTKNLEDASRRVTDGGGEVVLATPDFNELLARDDIQAVIVGTPDHWHVPVSVAACKAGKDVYCEKPLTHDVKEGKEIIDAQNEHARIVQVGTQQRSMPQFLKARELISEGRIGDVHKVHMSWNRNFLPFQKRAPEIDPKEFDWKRFLGNAPEQPFDPYRALGNWRWFWDFGAGILGDLMVHWLDAVNWILELGDPQEAVTVGDHFATRGVWETPDTIQTLLRYPEKRVQVNFEGTFVNQHLKAGVTFMGEKGTLYADRGRYEITPEPGSGSAAESFVPGTAVKGADFDVDGTSLHLANWIECVRSRQKPVAPAEAGVTASDAAHFANSAYREGKVARREA